MGNRLIQYRLNKTKTKLAIFSVSPNGQLRSLIEGMEWLSRSSRILDWLQLYDGTAFNFKTG